MGKIFSLFFAVASLVLVWGIIFQYRMSNRMMPVEGHLIDIHVKLGFEGGIPSPAGGRAYIVEPEYKYIVNGKMYEGNNVRVDGRQYIFKSNADEVVRSLKGQKTVTVWYDPLHPKYSILIKPAIQIRAVIGLCITLFLTIWCYKSLDNNLRKLDRYLKEKGVIKVKKINSIVILLLLMIFTSVGARADDLIKLQERHVISAGTDYKIYSGKYNVPITVSFIDKAAAKYDTPENTAIAHFSAMAKKDYQWWTEGWTSDSLVYMRDRDKELNRTPEYWIKRWGVITEKVPEIRYRADYTQYNNSYVLIGYALKGLIIQGKEFVGVLAFKKDGSRWLATQ